MKTFLIVLVTIVWGSTFFIVKDTTNNVNENLLVFSRIFLAAIPMVAYIFFKNKKSLFSKKSIIYGSVLGFLLVVTYLSQTIGLKYTSSGHSAFVTGTAVIMVPILMFFLYKAKFYKRDILSIIIILVGLFLLTYDTQTQFNKGDIITFITVIAAALHIILSGKFVLKTDTISLIAWQFISGSVFSFITLLIFDVKVDISTIPTNSVLALVYLGLIGTLFCYFISVWVQEFVESVKVALIFSLEPVFAAIFGFFALNEILNTKEITGMFMILTGVIAYQVLRKIKERKNNSLKHKIR